MSEPQCLDQPRQRESPYSDGQQSCGLLDLLREWASAQALEHTMRAVAASEIGDAVQGADRLVFRRTGLVDLLLRLEEDLANDAWSSTHRALQSAQDWGEEGACWLPVVLMAITALLQPNKPQHPAYENCRTAVLQAIRQGSARFARSRRLDGFLAMVLPALAKPLESGFATLEHIAQVRRELAQHEAAIARDEREVLARREQAEHLRAQAEMVIATEWAEGRASMAARMRWRPAAESLDQVRRYAQSLQLRALDPSARVALAEGAWDARGSGLSLQEWLAQSNTGLPGCGRDADLAESVLRSAMLIEPNTNHA